MNTAIQELTRFQIDRELHKQPYKPWNEHANIVEELLESIGFDVPKENRMKLVNAWTDFVEELSDNIAELKSEKDEGYRVDAYGDVIVFAIGAITKLGYDPEKVLLEIGKEINSREGKMVYGKFEKDLSIEAKSKWHKADFRWCLLDDNKKQRKRREAFFAATGQMGDDKEISAWVAELL